MLRKIFKWLDNFWYHYKWVTLVTAFFTVTLLIIIIQMITKTNPDSNILYGGPAVLTANQTKEIENAFNALLPEDFNGDGEKITSLQAITLMTKEQIAKAEAEAAENSSVFVYNPQSLENNKTSFSTQLFSGEYVICLIDPEQYKNAYKAGGFAPLSHALPADSCAAQTPPIHAVRLDSARMATVPPRAALLSASAVPIAGNLRRIRSEKRALWELLGVPDRRNRQGNPEYPADDGAGTVLLDFAAASG